MKWNVTAWEQKKLQRNDHETHCGWSLPFHNCCEDLTAEISGIVLAEAELTWAAQVRRL